MFLHISTQTLTLIKVLMLLVITIHVSPASRIYSKSLTGTFCQVVKSERKTTGKEMYIKVMRDKRNIWLRYFRSQDTEE